MEPDTSNDTSTTTQKLTSLYVVCAVFERAVVVLVVLAVIECAVVVAVVVAAVVVHTREQMCG